MHHRVISAALVGVDAGLVDVEVDIAGGLPVFITVGLAEAAVRESRVRVQAAIMNSGFPFPAGRISVNLAPAHVRKQGTGLDLPMAVGILAADGRVPTARLGETLVLGELSLSGKVRPVRGVLAAAEEAAKAGCRYALVAAENGPEAALVAGLEVREVAGLAEAVRWLSGDDGAARPVHPTEATETGPGVGPDLADVRGQPVARRALEVAAAGGHNLLFVGEPGSGKTMLARRLPGILPALTDAQALEVTRIHSAAGLTIGKTGLVRERPFRAPHHSTTGPGLVGGGSGIARPGELSLAHHGVLFLDELPEFPRAVLDLLRQPLESGEVHLSRATATVRYPARVQVVAAMNPCPCGYAGSVRRRCVCAPVHAARYASRVSGPLLDRVDIQLAVPPVELVALEGTSPGEPSSSVRARVAHARARQERRLGGIVNAAMSPRALSETVQLDDEGRRLLLRAVDRLGLSARAYDRVLRVARTVADLADDDGVRAPHIAEALSYRQLALRGERAA